MKNTIADLIGEAIRTTGTLNFPGKNSRLIPLWMSLQKETNSKLLELPGGGKIVCDLSIPYECMVWLKQEEERDLQILRKLLRPSDKFVDCGANIGLWSLSAAPVVGPEGKVFAFEPNPKTADKLCHNIEMSGFQNIQVFRSAVGASAGQQLLEAEAHHNVSRIVQDTSNSTIAVDTVTLDSVLESEKIAGFKIDIEGYELPALLGAQKILERDGPWLCVEFNSILAKTKRLSEWDVHNFLRYAGYEPRLFRDALTTSPKTRLNDDFENSNYCNLFYSRSI
jgi:FkbM family methyltransferase